MVPLRKRRVAARLGLISQFTTPSGCRMNAMHGDVPTASVGAGKWMALWAALLGWMFDGFEIGMFPLVGPKALEELLQKEAAVNPAIVNQWFGVIMSAFLIGAATGGVLFGWLG